MKLSLKKKLRGTRGISISEMLLCTLIVLLTMGLVGNTFTLGVQQVKARALDSKAEVLCSSLSQIVIDQLSYAITAKFDDTDDKLISFTSSASGLNTVPCRFTINDNGQLMLTYSDDNGSDHDRRAVSSANYTSRDGELKSEIAVSKSKSSGQFHVNIKVKAAGKTSAENDFYVTPLLNVDFS